MAGLGSLVVSLFADTAQFQSGLTRAQQKAQKAFRDIEQIAKVATVAITAATAAAAAMAKQAIDLADKISKTSQRIGVSTEFLSGLRYASDLAGISFEKLVVGMGMLAKNAADMQAGTGEARLAFAALNIEVEKTPGNLKSTEELLLDIAERFSMMEDSAGKTALAMKLFGESGKELITLLNAGRDGIEAFMERARQLGIVISTETGLAAEEFNNQMTDLGYVIEGIKIQMMSVMLPTFRGFASVMQDATKESGNFKDEFELLAKTIQTLGTGAIVTIYGFANAGRELGAGLAALVAAAKGDFAAAADIIERRAEDAADEFETLIKRLAMLRGELNEPIVPRGGNGRTPAFPNLQAAKAAADAMVKLADDRAKMELEAIKRATQMDMELLEAHHSAKLVSEQFYWDARMRIQRRALDAELAVIDSQIGRQRDVLAKSKSGSAEYYTALQKLEGLLAKRNQLEEEFAHKAELAYFETEQAAKQYAAVIEGINIRLLEMEGKTVEAARRRLALQNEEMRNLFIANRDEAGLTALRNLERAELAQIEFNKAREDAAAITTRLGIQEERIQNSRRVGAISELEALAQTSRARQQAAEELEGIVAAQEAVAEASKNPALVLQAEEARASLERLRSEMDLVADKINTVFEDAFADAFADFITGTKSAEEAFKQFAKTVINELARMYAKMIATQIFGGGGGGGGGIGGWLAGLIGGGGGGSLPAYGGAQDMTYTIFGFASGGRPQVGMPALVGEHGPELFVPDMSGTVVPTDRLGGDNYYIDAKGADEGAIRRLETTIRALNGSIERRAVNAVAGARRRGMMGP